jgi:hypothetical protein
MLDDDRTRIRVELRASVGGAEADGAKGPGFAAFIRRAAWGRGPRRPRRLGVAVEALEARLALSLDPPVVVPGPAIPIGRQDDVATSSNNLGTAVVWVDHNAPPGEAEIWLRYYDPSGKPDNTGSHLVDSSTGWTDSEPAVAIYEHDGIKGAAVVWTQTNKFGQKNVVGKTLLNPFDPPIPIAASGKAEYHPSIAWLPGKGLLVAYTLDYSSTDKDVMAKTFNGGLDQLSSFPVAQSGTLNEQAPSVAATPDGRFAIAYQVGKQSSPPNYDIALSRYGANGKLIDVKTIANTTEEETAPSVSLDDGFNGIVAYQSAPFFSAVGGATYNNVYAKRVTQSGVVGNPIQVATSTLDETNPSVALDHAAGNGKFVVAYDTVDPTFLFSSPTVIVKEYSGANVLQTTYNVASPSNRPQLSIDSNGNYFVVYDTSASTPTDPGGGVRLRHGHL